MGTVWHENHTDSLGFSRAVTSAADTARDAVLYGYNMLCPYLEASSFHGPSLLTKKRELFRRLVTTSPSSFALPLWMASHEDYATDLHSQVREY